MCLILVKYGWKLHLEILACVIYSVNFLQQESLYSLINLLCALRRILRTLNLPTVPQHQPKLGIQNRDFLLQVLDFFFPGGNLCFQNCVVPGFMARISDKCCKVSYVADKQILLQLLNLTVPEGGRVGRQEAGLPVLTSKPGLIWLLVLWHSL